MVGRRRSVGYAAATVGGNGAVGLGLMKRMSAGRATQMPLNGWPQQGMTGLVVSVLFFGDGI